MADKKRYSIHNRNSRVADIIVYLLSLRIKYCPSTDTSKACKMTINGDKGIR